VLILTLGVAPCFFDRETGAFGFVTGQLSPAVQRHLMSRYEMRMTSVAENVENIHAILASASRLAERPPKVVLTVSPVPLQATNEFHSAVIADCLSKSTLRLASHQAISETPEGQVVYWPSFEIVRWLGVHFGPAHPLVYGADDTNSRHVSQWLVDLIVDLFLETHQVRSGS
jgi:hypothetical protein